MNRRLQLPARFLAASCIAVLMLWASVALAGTTGKIAGTVLDAQSGQPAIGVNVLLVGTMLGASTGVDGTYFIINIPPGSYQLKASAVGFTPVVVENVKVSADQTTRINISITAQAVEMAGVEVVATKPIVQKDLTSTTATVGR